jgi:hypothetical protein
MEEVNMRRSVTGVMKIAVVAVAVTTIALSAGSALAFDPGDGRYEPAIEDRIAVYVHDTGIDVWGLDGNLNGVYLTTITPAMLDDLAVGESLVIETPEGTVTLRQAKVAVFDSGYDESLGTDVTYVSESAVYTISWSGGSYGANGDWHYTKTLTVTY